MAGLSDFEQHMLRGLADILQNETHKLQEANEARDRLLSLLDELEGIYTENREDLEKMRKLAWDIEDIDDLRRLYYRLEQALPRR